MSDYEFFNVGIEEGIATVVMHREPLNVLHIPMMRELNAVLEGLVSNSNLAAMVIRAEGKAFSAGVDVADHTRDRVVEMVREFHGIFRKLAQTDALTIAAVQGAALGGGCELACICDIVLASNRAKFGQPEVQVGVFPPVAACILPLIVGVKKGAEINAMGRTIVAAEALQIGLVNQVYSNETFDADVDAFIDGLRKLSRPVVRLAKRATCGATQKQMLARLDEVEAMYLEELMDLKDTDEGLAAFLEKRPAVWSHS